MTRRQIIHLTPEQQQALIAHREKWFKIGSSTEPADRPRAETAIAEVYRRAGHEPPQFIWCDSPLTANLTIRILNTGELLCSALRGALMKSLRGSLGVSLRDSLRTSLRTSLVHSLDGSTKEIGFPNFCLSGEHDAYWVAFFLFPQEYLGVRYDRADELTAWAEIAQSCGWLWAFEKFCIVTERPSIVRWSNDPIPVLHCADGPAVQFRDGWSIHAWRGMRVPAEWIEQKATIDPALALTHPNIEQRRALAEILGWERVLENLNKKMIDVDPDPSIGELFDVDLPDSPQSRFLRVVCGTGRTLVLSVPQYVNTAIEANAWTYDITSEELRQLEVRT